MSWVLDNLDVIAGYTGAHLVQALPPILLALAGTALSVQLWSARRDAALSGMVRDAAALNAEAEALNRMLSERDIDEVFEEGLHEFLQAFLADNARLAAAIARDYRFTE